MQEKKSKDAEIYRFADLSKYPLKQRFAIKTADMLFYSMIKTIGKTLKFEIKNQEFEIEALSSGKKPIYTFWHNRIFTATYHFRNQGIVVMTSQSFDGEYIARFIQRLGYGAARGSSSKGGIAALVEMIRAVKQGIAAAFTIDGPRGPMYQAKPGACLLAKKTGSPILPFVVECEKYYEAKSWDKLQIPKPFSKACVIFAKPIYISADADEQILENKLKELQQSLDELVKLGEQWRKHKV